jgi:hypothetical protein
MLRWGGGNNRPSFSWSPSASIIFLLCSYLLLALNYQRAWALEPGSGRVRLIQGSQNTGAGFERFDYFGLGVDLEQTTLNWGKWQANFLGLGDHWGQRPQLGYGFLGVSRLWLRDQLEGDFFLGDALLEVGTSCFPFEHFVVPQQNYRGLGTRLYGSNYALGAHAGTLTFLSFQFSEAFVRSDTNLAGFYLRLGNIRKPHLGLSLDGFSDPSGKRTLSNIDLTYPLGGPQAKALAWYDSRSGRSAGVIGVRQGKGPTQWEVGASAVPFGFVYLSNNATLASGQTVGFFTYRHVALTRDYFVEGSAGRLSFGRDHSWLVRGTVGGGWRFRLRDYLGGSLGVSYQGGGNQQQQLHLLPTLRYSRSRGPLNLYAQIMSDYYSVQLVRRGGAVLFQPQPLGALPETQSTSVFRNSVDLGFDYSPPTATRWGASLRLDDTRTQGPRTSSFRAATGELRMSKYLPYDIHLDLSVRSGVTFSQAGTSALHSAGLRLNFTYFGDWLIYVEGRFYYSHFPQEFTAYTAIPNPAYEVRSGLERRFFWGEAAPVFGNFPSGGFKGVGTLSGLVFEDRNNNGVFDAGDIPLKDAVLRLDDGYVVETDSRGRYYYANVADGEHTFQLDPESYPVRLTTRYPEGMEIKLHPREQLHIDWPLSRR